MMNWGDLLCQHKIFKSTLRINMDNARSEFERDHNKIIFAPSFRGLQNKTQLFPVPNNEFIHNRLTHSLEVAEVGKSIAILVAQNIAENNLYSSVDAEFSKNVADVVSAACLLHDVGNPPFGHSGEDAISRYFRANSVYLSRQLPATLIDELAHFEGNAQTLRIINTANTLNLTLATVATVVKYPVLNHFTTVYKSGHGVFSSEWALLEKAYTACKIVKIKNDDVYARHPLTFLVEAADDICYRILDLEDAHKIGIISYVSAENLLLQIIKAKRDNLEVIKSFIDGLNIEDRFARLRSYAINILINEVVLQFIKYYYQIMSGDYSCLIVRGKLCGLIDLLINDRSELSDALEQLTGYISTNAYSYRPLVEVELAGYEIIGFLLNQFISAVIGDNSKHGSRLIRLLPQRIRLDDAKPSQRVVAIVDYISSMTDKFAFGLYRKLKGIDLSST